ncbi:hypothetical protein [Vibrio sp. EA2]|uniref:hypothetical protein n=1 Tax=Vibrio sp. EA2 TaxID=3079860 RepID=UPI0039825240
MKQQSRKKTATIVCTVGLALSMTFATNGGLLLLDLVDHFVNNVGILSSCLVEIILMTWLCKLADVRSYVNKISDFSVGVWFEVCLRFITPVVLAIIVATKFINLIVEGYGGYAPFELMVLGWGLILALLITGIYINLVAPTRPSLIEEN